MKRQQWVHRIGAAVVIGMLTAAPLWAQATNTPAAGALFNASDTIRDALRRIQVAGKPAELVLKNGKSYKGTIGDVGDHGVVITQIQGREFFDALIELEDVSAIEVRARGDH